MRKTNSRGFTLVELLIVIALIAILSVAVLATLNPIEQANKARDARVQNDAGEILGAYERYFAAKQQYPWVTFTGKDVGGTTITADAAVVLRSDKFGFGICHGSANALAEDAADGATNCDPSDTHQNLLISTGELKTSIIGRDEFAPVLADSTKSEQALWAVKAANSDSVYVCYVPKSVASRSDTANMSCITAAGVISKTSATCTAQAVNATTFSDPEAAITAGNIAIFRCIP